MSIPSLIDIVNNINKDFVEGIKKKYPEFDPNLQGKNIFNGWSIGIAPTIRNLYLENLQASKQATPIHADSKRDNPSYGSLEDWGEIFLNRYPFVASRGKYKITFDGTGGTLLQGTILTNQNTQETYTVDNDTIVNGTIDVNITATSNGEKGRLFAGDILVLFQLVENVEAQGIIKSEEKPPVDEEDIEEYRTKILEKAVITPRGGSIGDIVIYGLGVDGVKNIYPYNGDVLGSGEVFIKADKSVNPDGIPPSSLIQDVKNKVLFNGNFQAPNINFLPIIRRKYIVEISGLSNLSKKPIIEDTINNYFDSREPVIDGVTALNQVNKDLILSSAIFSEVIQIIQPDIITRLELKVENTINNGFLQTKDLTSVTTLYGSSAPSDGAFKIAKDGQSPIVFNVNGQSVGNLEDYALLVGQQSQQSGIRTLLIIDGAKKYLKFESDTAGASSSIDVLPPSAGTDLTGANYFDLADPSTIKTSGGVTNIVKLDSERLPKGNIPYAGSVIYL